MLQIGRFSLVEKQNHESIVGGIVDWVHDPSNFSGG
jgi:hypothetical protein